MQLFRWMAFLALVASNAWAASCPYCGRSYGGGMGSGADASYISSIRAAHESSCPSRPKPQANVQRSTQPAAAPGPSAKDLGSQATWYGREIARLDEQTDNYDDLASKFRSELPNATSKSTYFQMLSSQLEQEKMRLFQSWGELQNVVHGLQAIAQTSHANADKAWALYLAELDKLYRAGKLAGPATKVRPPFVADYGSDKATRLIEMGFNDEPRRTPPVLNDYYPEYLDFEKQLDRLRPQWQFPVRAVRALPARAAPYYATATQARVDTMRRAWQEASKKNSAAYAVQDALCEELNRHINTYNNVIKRLPKDRDAARAEDRLFRYSADRVIAAGKSWAVGQVKEAIAKQALDEVRRRAPHLAAGAEEAKAVLRDFKDRYAPAIASLKRMHDHAQTMKNQVGKWEGFFGDLRVIIASRFDGKACAELEEKLDVNNRHLRHETIKNAGGSEATYEVLDFLISYDLRNVFRKP